MEVSSLCKGLSLFRRLLPFGLEIRGTLIARDGRESNERLGLFAGPLE
jgi:hypothetical protein